MTFSLVARDDTGACGAAVCSSSPAVAARCIRVVDGVGASASQNVTDPRLGPDLLRRVGGGLPAPRALQAVVDATADIEYRQLLLVDAAGRAAAFSGPQALGVFGDATGRGVAAGGNLLADARIPQLIVDAFEAARGDLESRLLVALRAAMEAGGEAGPVHSAGLLTVRNTGWPVTDLRVDWTDENPVDELGRLLELWLPQRADYVTRALEPRQAPGFGVAGDE